MHQTRLVEALEEVNAARHSLQRESRKRRGYEIYLEDQERSMKERTLADNKNSELLTELTRLQSYMRQQIAVLQGQVSHHKRQVLQAKEQIKQESERMAQQTRLVQIRHEEESTRLQEAADAQQRKFNDKEVDLRRQSVEDKRSLARHVLTAIQSTLGLEERRLSPEILDEFVELEAAARVATNITPTMFFATRVLFGGLLITNPMAYWLATRLGGNVSFISPPATLVGQQVVPWVLSISQLLLQQREHEFLTAKRLCMHLHHLNVLRQDVELSDHQVSAVENVLDALHTLELVNKSVILSAMQQRTDQSVGAFWTTRAISKARSAEDPDQIYVLDFSNSDRGEFVLLRDPSADLFVIVQNPGQESENVLIFEYSDIVDCHWAQDETVTLHINAASTVPEHLKSVVIQNRLTPGSGVLGWIAHVEHLVKFTT